MGELTTETLRTNLQYLNNFSMTTKFTNTRYTILKHITKLICFKTIRFESEKVSFCLRRIAHLGTEM